MGTLLFIFLGVMILFIALTFFFLGRKSGLRQAEKIVENCTTNESFNIGTFRTRAECKRIDCSPFIAIGVYVALIIFLFFAGECTDVHNNIIKKYNNGDYVQVEDTRSFVTADSTKFEKISPVRYYTKKEFERIVKQEDLNKID